MELISIYKKSQLHKIISSDISAGMLSHCYLLSGMDSVVINEFAYIVTKEIFCLSDNAPCEGCINCNKINHSNMVDVITYPKGDKGLMVDDINEIVSDCFIRPIESKYKVYILKNFDGCTIQAQNKILKTLEEPPQNVIFILTTTSVGLVLPTILSRSKKIDIPLLSREEMVEVLSKEGLSNASDLASISGFNLGVVLTLAGSKESASLTSLAFEVLMGLNASSDVLKFSSKMVALKKNVPLFLNLIVSVLRDILVEEKYRNFSGRDRDFDVLKCRYSARAINRIEEHISTMFLRLEFNANINGLIDEFLLKILEVRFLCQ